MGQCKALIHLGSSVETNPSLAAKYTHVSLCITDTRTTDRNHRAKIVQSKGNCVIGKMKQPRTLWKTSRGCHLQQLLIITWAKDNVFLLVPEEHKSTSQTAPPDPPHQPSRQEEQHRTSRSTPLGHPRDRSVEIHGSVSRVRRICAAITYYTLVLRSGRECYTSELKVQQSIGF